MEEVQRAILVVDDEEIARETLDLVLRERDYRVATAPDGQRAIRLLQEQVFDVVVADLKMEGMNGLDVLEAVKESWPDVEVIVITGYASLDTAKEAIKKGAYDYIVKPFKMDEVTQTIRGAVEKRGRLEEDERLRRELEERYRYSEIIGKSPMMLKVFDLITKAADTDSSVLISGETGTGKELVARVIHNRSLRSGRPFVTVNCGAFSEEELTRELFAQAREGTAAGTAVKGLLEEADGGTIYLDEITETTPGVQVKLLRFLQEKEITHIGGMQPKTLDVRVIAGTNRSPRRAVQKGWFRQDLYYRLSVVEIHMPALSERKEDIPLLAQHFLDRYCRKQGIEKKRFSSEALKRLKTYEYPGNVRELANIVQRAAVLATGEEVEGRHLPQELMSVRMKSPRNETAGLPSLQDQESKHIQRVLASTGYNRTRAAEILGLDRSTLWRKMKKYGL